MFEDYGCGMFVGEVLYFYLELVVCFIVLFGIEFLWEFSFGFDFDFLMSGIYMIVENCVFVFVLCGFDF